MESIKVSNLFNQTSKFSYKCSKTGPIYPVYRTNRPRLFQIIEKIHIVSGGVRAAVASVHSAISSSLFKLNIMRTYYIYARGTCQYRHPGGDVPCRQGRGEKNFSVCNKAPVSLRVVRALYLDYSVGRAGGILAKMDFSSSSVSAFDHSAIPVFQTKLPGKNWPAAAICCKTARSNGPVACPLTAT